MYADALVEGIEFRRRIENGLEETTPDRFKMNIAEALVYFDQYLKGETQYAHLKKEVSNKNPKTKKINYSKLSLIQLEKAVAIAVKNEDYELAAFLRDEINRKK